MGTLQIDLLRRMRKKRQVSGKDEPGGPDWFGGWKKKHPSEPPAIGGYASRIEEVVQKVFENQQVWKKLLASDKNWDQIRTHADCEPELNHRTSDLPDRCASSGRSF